MQWLMGSIRNKILLITGIGTGLLLAAALYGFRDAELDSDELMAGLGLMAVAILIAFVVFITYLQRQVLTPTRELAEHLRRLAEGDFSQPIKRKTHDELGDIADSAETIRIVLSGTISEVAQSSNDITDAVDQLTDVINITRQGVEDQLKQTEQVAGAITEMNATMREVADNANHAAEAAQQADSEADSGRRVVGRTIDDIDALAREVEQAAGVIDRLGQDSEAIGAVLDVIQGISEQTNLLALNAAIEAARAGEQGRGFAVVADEVRALASRTKQATSEVNEMIQRLQSGAREAVKVMHKSQENAQASVTQASEAGGSLQAITAAVARINEMNGQIADASVQQSRLSGDLNQSIDRITEVAEYSAEGTKRIDEANRGLTRSSEQLRGLVGKFKL